MKRFLAALLAALTVFTLTGCGKTENPAEPVTPGQAEEPTAPTEPEPTPEEIAIDEDEKKRLREAVDLLPRDMREAVGLVICGGMSYRDAAAIMGVGTKRVDNLVSRAKKRLKTELSGGDKE